MNAPIISNNFYPIKKTNNDDSVQMVLIGAGIMSATLGTFLSILEPSWNIHIYERMQKPAQESSNSWNNAGTGHAAFCELNYTEYNKQNDFINIEKALTINNLFELSLQFWSYLVKNKILNNPKSFINNIPHMSFVWGENDVLFLKRRFQELKKNIVFDSIIYSEDFKKIYDWIPLMMKGRDKNQKIAVTRTEMGTDVNFEEITQQLFKFLKRNSNFKLYFQHNIECIKKHNDKIWNIKITDIQNKTKKYINTHYVFIGGGGKSLNLLQTTKIPEIKGYAGFPVGGQFLVTYNPKIVNQHSAKVYGKTSLNIPPMSIPHMDTRILNGKKILLFGPFATFSSKFLKHGSWLDLLNSLNQDNLIPMIQAGIDNLDLIKYLFNQLIMSHKDRIHELRKYYPQVDPKDWSLIQAGQRVQIIKKNKNNKGILQFGTEILTSKDRTISALLGASPGASISVSIAIQILYSMFNKEIQYKSWNNQLKEIIPFYDHKHQNMTKATMYHIQENTRNILNLFSMNDL